MDEETHRVMAKVHMNQQYLAPSTAASMGKCELAGTILAPGTFSSALALGADVSATAAHERCRSTLGSTGCGPPAAD